MPLALSGLQKNGSRWHVPACAFAPHASGMPSSDREDSRLYLTIFILWGVEPLYMTLLVKSAEMSLFYSELCGWGIFGHLSEKPFQIGLVVYLQPADNSRFPRI